MLTASRISLALVLAASLAFPLAVRGAPPSAPRIEKDVTYVRRGQLELKADVYLPAGAGPFPTILLVHGGGWSGGDKVIMAGLGQLMNLYGYASVAISYRLAPRSTHPAQIEDCRAAIRWIKDNAARYSFDPSRLAGWGHSAGAHLVALLATTGNERGGQRLNAAILGSGPTDLVSIMRDSSVKPRALDLVRQYLGPAAKRDVYRNASPISHVDAGDPPTFIYHGVLDDVVPIAQAEELKEALEKAHVTVEYHRVEDAGHTGMTPGVRAAFVAAVAFLDREVKAKRATAPSAAPSSASTTTGPGTLR